MKIKRLFFVVVFGVLAGCKIMQPAHINTAVYDSVSMEVQEVVRDTTISVPYEGLSDTIYLPCPDTVQNKFKPVLKQSESGRTKLAVKQSGNKMVVNCECDSVAIRAQLKNTYERVYKEKLQQNTETKKVQYIPYWAKFLVVSGVILWIILLIAFILKFLKP